MAYKPFGEKLNLDKDGKESTIAPYTNRGYTGHEHIEETNLIHMNGRVCDPTIGRFLSADPYIPSPYSTQSFNRYSYVKNNPLKYIDPSGYTDIGTINVVATVIIDNASNSNFNFNFDNFWMPDIYIDTFNYVNAQRNWERQMNEYYNQIYIQQFVQAQLQQNLNYQSMSSSYLTIGKFAILQPTNQAPNSISQSALSRTLSRVTGGKFANGANTRTFVYGLNGIQSNRDYNKALNINLGDEELVQGWLNDFLYNASDFSAGFGDTISFGATESFRVAYGYNNVVNKYSTTYKAGEYTTFALGVGRLAYAGLAKGVSLIPSITGRQASAFRNVLKKAFRLNPLSKFRVYPYEKLLKKYGSDMAVKSAAGRTSMPLNRLGALGATGGMYEAE